PISVITAPSSSSVVFSRSALLSMSVLRFLLRLAPIPTLFPYTTLFRSLMAREEWFPIEQVTGFTLRASLGTAGNVPNYSAQYERSEEHTSELQSRENLVCRLLLEKKNLLPSLKVVSSLPSPARDPTPLD